MATAHPTFNDFFYNRLFALNHKKTNAIVRRLKHVKMGV